MVKIADLEQNDATVRLLRFIFSLRTRQSPLAPDRVQQVVATTLRTDLAGLLQKHSSTNSQFDLPTVTFKSSCSGPGLNYYPVAYDLDQDKLTVCLDKIKDETILRENIIREFHLARSAPKSGLSWDENLMRSCYLACRESLKIYTKDQEELRGVSTTCAKHLFKYRCPNWPQRFSKDVFSRYTLRLLNDTVAAEI